MHAGRRRIAMSVATMITVAGWSLAAPTAWAQVPPPVIATPTEGALVLESVAASGTTIPGTLLVSVLANGSTVGSDVPDDNGNWSAPLNLQDGTHTIVARAVDADGDISPDSPPRTFTVDLAPTQPTITRPASNATVGTGTIEVAGTADNDTTVTVTENGTVLASSLLVSGRNWTTSITFAEGAHTITATSIDARGRSVSSTRTFTIDLTAPAAPTITTPTADAWLNSTSVTVSGTAEPRADVVITRGTQTYSTTANGSGSWSRTISAPEGPHTITARAKDAAGNQSPSTSRSFTVDATAPTASIATPANALFLPGDPGTITGTASDNRGVARVEVRFEHYTGAHVTTVDARCTGCPATSVAWHRDANLNPAYYRAEVTAIDRAGNRSVTVEVAFARL